MPSNSSNKKEEKEYNPRWKGYTFIALGSLINFSAVSSVDRDYVHKGSWGASLSFGIVMFVLSALVLFVDRTQLGVDKFNYSKAYDGNFEGGCLVVLLVYSIVAVGYTTQVGGIAYLALNIYFSAWLMSAASLYTLNKWSASKDILTIGEMTSISATLKSWYVLLLGSVVVMGSSANMLLVIEDTAGGRVLEKEGAAAFGIAFGFFSAVLSILFILVHYNIIEFMVEGGWMELFWIAVVFIMWIVGVAVLTQSSSIASTIVGTGCRGLYEVAADSRLLEIIEDEIEYAVETNTIPDCTVIIRNVSYFCDDLLTDDDQEYRNDGNEIHIVPGSNLYMSVWTCLIASVNLAFRWKAQQALQFAKAQEAKAVREQMKKETEKINEDSSNHAEDLDEFEDATGY